MFYKYRKLYKSDDNDIISMEPFIEDYYPRNEEPIFQNEKQSFDEQNNQQFSDDFSFNGSKDETESIKNNQEHHDSDVIEVSKELTDQENKEVTNLKETQNNTKEKELYNQKIQTKSKEQEINISYVWYQPYPVYYPVGNGRFNIDKSIEDIKWIIKNLSLDIQEGLNNEGDKRTITTIC